MMKAKIIGLGSYLPENILTNADLEKMVDTSDEWIVTRTGIKERRIAKKEEYTSDLGLAAAKKAIKDAKISKEDIDLILFATLTPDYIFPSTACLLQDKLKIKAAAMDFQAACSGYIYALDMAKALVEQKAYKNVLVVAAEKLSSIVDYEDRTTCVLFGDGAAASIVSLGKKGYSIEATCIGADGSQSDLLILPAGGSRFPANLETITKKMHYLRMSGKEVFKHAVRRMVNASKECLNKLNMKEEDIDILIPHQANRRIIDAVAKRFPHLSSEKVCKDVVEKYGNTSASSVGIVLDELKKNGKIGKKEKILLTTFGAGFTWGAAILSKD